MVDSHTALIFAPSKATTARAVARALDSDPRLSQGACRICSDERTVYATLKQLPHRRCIIILLAGCQTELDRMLALAAWFADFPLILRPPDDQRDTLAKAHQLRPRYLTGLRIDFPELREVVAKLLFRQQLYRPSGVPRSQPVLITRLCRPHCYFRIRKTPLMRRRKGITAGVQTSTMTIERKNHV